VSIKDKKRKKVGRSRNKEKRKEKQVGKKPAGLYFDQKSSI